MTKLNPLDMIGEFFGACFMNLPVIAVASVLFAGWYSFNYGEVEDPQQQSAGEQAGKEAKEYWNGYLKGILQ